MHESLGAWANAPLAYVLAEVRTELIAEIKDYQPKIAGRLREEYPIQRAVQSARVVAAGAKVTVEAEQQDSAWECASPDNHRAVILRPNGIVFHATAYSESKEFLGRLQKVVTIFAQEVRAVFVSRLGLRYVDFIIPKDDEKPELYVDRRLHVDLGLAQERGPAATCAAIYPMRAGQLTLRYVRMEGEPRLPPDLGTTLLDKADIAKTVVKPDHFTGVLDTDRTVTFSPVERLEPAKISDHFAFMRDDIRKAFDTATTEYGRKVWNPS